nr:MAG TPA: hypothetical protein [Bacteriophage sp.]
MSFSFELVLQIVIQAVTVSAIVTAVRCSQRFTEEKLNSLEKKQDKHNSLIERMVIVEQSCKSAHHRIDENIQRIDYDNHRVDGILEVIHECSSTQRFGNKTSFGKD